MKFSKIVVPICMLVVIGFALSEFFSNQERKGKKIQDKRMVVEELSELKEIALTTEDGKEMTFERRGILWWIVEPVLYPVRMENFRASYDMMLRILSEETFLEKEGKIDFSNPRASLRLTTETGTVKKMVVAPQKSAGGMIYVKNLSQETVHAIHSAWGQFLQQPLAATLSGSLWPGAGVLTGLEWSWNNKVVWEMKSLEKKSWGIIKNGKTQILKPTEAMTLLRAFHDVQMKAHQIGVPDPGHGSGHLRVSTQTGSQEIRFDDTLGKVYLKKYSTAGVIDPKVWKKILNMMKKRESL